MVNRILTRAPARGRPQTGAKTGPLAGSGRFEIPLTAQYNAPEGGTRLAKSPTGTLCSGCWRFQSSGSAAFWHPTSLSFDPAETMPQEAAGGGWSAAADAYFEG